MARLDPEKLQVTYLAGITADTLTVPRYYTLTHSDFTSRLYLSIGQSYDKKQISGFYTRLMRDEVLIELAGDEDTMAFRVYCHVSGGFVIGTAKWRYEIFRTELPLVLEAIRYGDRTIFENNPFLDRIPVYIHFQSTDARYRKVEAWQKMSEYRLS